MRFWLVWACLLLCGTAFAETCKYIDKEGRTIYSNIPLKHARKVACFQPPAPVEQPDSGNAVTETKTATPAGTPGRPRVDPSTQRQRDTNRRQILEDELAREQDALTAAKKALADQQSLPGNATRNDPAAEERVQSYAEAITLHEKNIGSLRQELANLK